MKLKVNLVIVCLFSLILFNGLNLDCELNYFTTLEKKVNEISEFKENGVKITYKTRGSIQNTYLELKNNIKDIKGKKTFEKEMITLSNEKLSIKFILWSEGEFTRVESELINKGSGKNVGSIKKFFEKLQVKNPLGTRYFYYIKGKIKSAEDSLGELLGIANFKEYEEIPANNGIYGSGVSEFGHKININISKYNSGNYIIIGSPIIFATY